MRKMMRLAIPGNRPGIGGASCRRARMGNAGGGVNQAAAQICRKAEVNPVTGHALLCIDPLGALVEAP